MLDGGYVLRSSPTTVLFCSTVFVSSVGHDYVCSLLEQPDLYTAQLTRLGTLTWLYIGYQGYSFWRPDSQWFEENTENKSSFNGLTFVIEKFSVVLQVMLAIRIPRIRESYFFRLRSHWSGSALLKISLTEALPSVPKRGTGSLRKVVGIGDVMEPFA